MEEKKQFRETGGASKVFGWSRQQKQQHQQLTSVSNAWVLLMSISGGKMLGNCRKLGMKGETLAAATTAAIWLLACSVGD